MLVSVAFDIDELVSVEVDADVDVLVLVSVEVDADVLVVVACNESQFSTEFKGKTKLNGKRLELLNNALTSSVIDK